MLNLKIFIIFHSEIKLAFYNDELLPYLIFVNVNQNNSNLNPELNSKLNIIDLYNMPNYKKLGKQYAESEVIYNLTINNILLANLDFIGFLHHDMDISKISLENLCSLCKKYTLISFDSHIVKNEYNNLYLMDHRKPNQWQGLGRNCYDEILDDINKFQKTDITIKGIQNNHINLCCAFLLKYSDFETLMSFICKIIESNKLEIFDTKNRYRMQGGLLERYIGLWLTINVKNYIYLEIDHHFHETILSNFHGYHILSIIKRLKLRLIRAFIKI